MDNSKLLFNAVMKFLKVTNECLEQTNYAEDRRAYEKDIALCSTWLIKLYDKVNVEIIISEIKAAQTDKNILDYYKRGIFGEKQAKALIVLQNEISNL